MAIDIKYLVLGILFLFVPVSCDEHGRFEISGDDKLAPAPPEYLGYKSIVGGVRVFYNPPKDNDILSVNAEYIHANGKTSIFSASYFVDSLDVFGFPDTLNHVVNLYAIDRAGNRSDMVPITVKVVKSSLQEVASTIEILPAFNAFIVSWKNELKQNIHVYIDMFFKKGIETRDLTWVFTSKKPIAKEVLNNIILSDDETLSVNVRVGDTYGNIMPSIPIGNIEVMNDEYIPKDSWRIPNTNDSIAGIPMCFGNGYESKSLYVFDGIISRGKVMNVMHTAEKGRTGKQEDGNAPWNFLIDLGDYYELSRIVTNQRHDLNARPFSPYVRGNYYCYDNVNKYNMYYLDEESQEWVFISQHTIEVPVGISDLDFSIMGSNGDMALMYPDVPAFTKPTRWFRYEALSGFGMSPLVLSEITLYGRKAYEK